MRSCFFNFCAYFPRTRASLPKHFRRFSPLPTPSFIYHSSFALVDVSLLTFYISHQRSLTDFEVYTNSLLASLNARETLAKLIHESSGDTNLSSLQDAVKISRVIHQNLHDTVTNSEEIGKVHIFHFRFSDK